MSGNFDLGGSVVDLDQALDAHDSVFVLVSPEECERGDVARVLGVLQSLGRDAERARRLTGSLVFAFDGYDRDPREVWQIPECIHFVAMISQRWCHWLRFVDRDAAQVRVIVGLHAQRWALLAQPGVGSMRMGIPRKEFLAAAVELMDKTSEADRRLGLSDAETRAALGDVAPMLLQEQRAERRAHGSADRGG